jgi:cholesterol oxidase
MGDVDADEVDAVVIGSGFGGSVAAARLAEAGKSVIVLERGKAYPPGSFARSPYEMGRSFWDPSKGLHGMFDLWSFSDIDAVVSAGLGGGSLIYANVMIRKDEHWFVQEDPRSGPGYEYWPVNREQLDPDYDVAERMLGATAFPFEFAPYSMAPKTQAMKSAANAIVEGGRKDLSWKLPKLAVYFGGDTPAPSTPFIGESFHGPSAFRRGCRLCGECDIGCNDGAKNSLDYNYLTLAHQKGADIRVRHDVKEFEHHPKGGYVVRYRDLTDYEGVDAKHAPRGELRCKVLVVSAGALGSTYLMLENERRLGGLPSALGTKFCGNGDLLGFVRTRDGRVLAGTRGPVITSTMRVDDELDPGGAGTGRGFYLQDGGYPGFADWIIETTSLPNRLWRSLKLGATLLANRLRHHRTNHLSLAVSQLAGASSISSGSLPMLGMGRDVPDGVMRLDGDWLEIDWNVESSREYFSRVKQLMGQVARELDGELVVNPTWWLKRVVTVHPLGGCPMGTHAELPPVGEQGAPGVVDDHGEVFGHPGLFVTDGSVMPGPVGPNPSLTIAALAERFSRRMIERVG